MSDYYIGLMSGTSMDGIDAVLVDFSSNTPTLVESLAYPWPDTLKSSLLTLASNPNSSITDFGTLDAEAGKCFASAVLALLKNTDLRANDIISIGSHGQTVLHSPSTPTAFSLQIGDPNQVAEITGITTVADFRRRDIAAGGQGAPLVPAMHSELFYSNKENRVVLNIGGMANITKLPAATKTDVSGFDTGPGNVLLDAWVAQHNNAQYDKAGDWARMGKVNETLLKRLRKHPYFSAKPPKSTGREDFNFDWLREQLQHAINIQPEDVQATLTALTVTTIADAIRKHASETQRVLVCGGGIHNSYMLQQLQESLTDVIIESTGKYGAHPDWVEAIAFAWFAKQTLEKKPSNLPSVTGAKRPVILGGIYQA